MKKVKGDLLKMAREGKFNVIVHGCNCFCRMGAGIAKQIADQFPEAYEIDKNTTAGDKAKLGKFTELTVMRHEISFHIVNAYTQYRFDGRKKGEMDVDYDAIRGVMRKINTRFSGLKVGYPLIGAGLAGGDWNIISKIIDEELVDVDHTLVEYDPKA